MRQVRMKDYRVARIERDQRATTLVEYAGIGVGGVVVELHRAPGMRAREDLEPTVRLVGGYDVVHSLGNAPGCWISVLSRT